MNKPEPEQPQTISPQRGGPAGSNAEAPAPFLPAATLPKGGGAIRGIGEKFSVNPSRGTGSVAVPVFTTPGRGGFGPSLSLGYDSGAGNTAYGLGFGLAVPMINRKTDKGLPLYTDADTFVLAGAEDLVPSAEHAAYQEGDLQVERFRQRTEGSFARIERCRNGDTGETFWRITGPDNVTSLLRVTVADPGDPRRVFQWLLDETRDDRGNVARYEYVAENLSGVDGAASWERHRQGAQPQRYLKAIRYGNRTPGGEDWCFHAVFDYGDHDELAPALEPDRPWPARPDAFSTYRPGFDLRTWRQCRRVLMFHDFPGGELGDGPLPRLVRSTDLVHDDDPAGVHLLSVTQIGHQWDGNAYISQSLPPVEFDYTRSAPEDIVRAADAGSVANLPSGVDGEVYKWADLDGEGVSGALTQQGGAWFYKRNLGGGKLGAVEHVPLQPAISGGESTPMLVDVGGDGSRAIVRNGQLSGFQERTRDGSWGPFTAFRSTALVDWADPALHHVDLDGDGLADLLLTGAEEVRWHRGLGREGYAEQRRVAHSRDENRGPVLLRTGQTEAVLLADMSGDGLSDLVRIRNGEVCYWPNLGHGRFGAKVAMAGSPLCDHPDQFDPARLRLADIDGTGTADILYLGRGRVSFWRNRSGNHFGATEQLSAIPDTDRIETIEVVDLLGTGTSCLVWSSPKAADQREPLRYVDLSRGVDDPSRAGHKPQLLCLTRNNLGGQTRLSYAPSTKFYLADQAAGTPWVTKLAFPVHVVERVEAEDLIAKTRLVTEYRYRHGYFGGVEREFRGFGMVEQLDAETFPPRPGDQTELHRPPVRTRTWFHTGAFLDERLVSTHLAGEYYSGDASLADSEVDVVDAREHAQARRALAGQPLRVEVYADDGSDQAPHPYTVTETRYRVVRVQSSTGERPAVFRSHPLETVIWHYERDPADPRVSHQVTLEVDEFNVVRRGAAIQYPRRTPEIAEQDRLAIVMTHTQVAHQPAATGPYRIGVAVRTQTFEVTGLSPATDRFTVSELDVTLADIPFEETPTAGVPQRRLIEHVRLRYWDDDLTAPRQLGEFGTRALPHSTYKIAFTDGLLTQVYAGRVNESMLVDEGRYLLADGVWWIPSGVQVFDKDHFYLPSQLIDPFGNTSSVDYDQYLLVPVTAQASHHAPFDVLITTTEHDYRLMAVHKLVDPNGNRSRVAFDTLGRVVATWVNGKEGSAEGDPDGLPGAVFTYGESSWYQGNGPVWALAESREEHGGQSFQRARAYSDGSGRVVMTKAQAEPGLAWTIVDGTPVQIDTGTQVRWVGTGRTVFDNKGQLVKQYEPYFSVDDGYEDEAALVEQGVTPILHYDPVGRLVRTDFPDGTHSRVVFDPWRQESWDPVDTVIESLWYAERGSPAANGSEPADTEQRAAWLAAHHAATPAVSHLDSQGRAVRLVADGGALGKFETMTDLDIEGNTRSVTDARGVKVQTQEVDLAGRVLHTDSPDAGERWTLVDIAGTPIRSWDSRGQSFRRTYDLLRRPVGLWAGSVLVSLTVYGETHVNALDRNLRGKAHLSFDGAGMSIAMRFDFKGNLVVGRRRLAVTYQNAPDWSSLDGLALSDVEPVAEALLEQNIYASATDFDALNRPRLQVLPDTTVIEPTYNEGGALETVSVKLPGQVTGSLYVTDLDYDAKGQRTLIAYGNGVTTSYEYDPLTYRLARLLTVRGAEVSQDLAYTYDPVGNVVEIRDDSQQAVFFAGQVVEPSTRYVYDALGRLSSASGREHASLGVQPDSSSPAFAPVPHPNDASAVRLYRQSYEYDGVGNILSLLHEAGTGSYTRIHDIAPDSNRLVRHSLPGAQSTPDFTYDEHGNMTVLNGQALTWDHADRLASVDLGGGGMAYYTYDGSGQRVRKVLVRAGGLVEERVYLGGYEEHLRRMNGTLTFQRNTVHVMDDAQRIALIETLVIGDSPGTRVRYQLGNHLGSCVLELAADAAVVSYEEYHPYGTTSLWLGASGVEVSDRRYRYTGKEKDEETGLYYHGARYYIPWLARWSSPDPSGLVDGTNLYAYVGQNPVVKIDPNGRAGTTVTINFGSAGSYIPKKIDWFAKDITAGVAPPPSTTFALAESVAASRPLSPTVPSRDTLRYREMTALVGPVSVEKFAASRVAAQSLATLKEPVIKPVPDPITPPLKMLAINGLMTEAARSAPRDRAADVAASRQVPGGPIPNSVDLRNPNTDPSSIVSSMVKSLGTADMAIVVPEILAGGLASEQLTPEKLPGALKDVTIHAGASGFQFSLDSVRTVEPVKGPYWGVAVNVAVGGAILENGKAVLKADEVFNSSAVTYKEAAGTLGQVATFSIGLTLGLAGPTIPDDEAPKKPPGPAALIDDAGILTVTGKSTTTYQTSLQPTFFIKGTF